jgi:glycosyltransferase involved in cell wall biosynthesis
MKDKKIAIVHDFLIEFGGAEKVLLDILEIYPRADLYTLFYDQKKLGELFDKYEPKTTFVQKLPKLLKGAPLRPLLPIATESIKVNKYDLVISNCNSFSKGILTPQDVTHISYLHSPTRYLWDYYHRYIEEHKLGGWKSGFTLPIFSYLRLWDKSASKRPDNYLANSNNVKKRINKFYRRKAEVVYPGIDLDEFYSDKKGNYFLIVSRLSKYKNIDLAIKAFNKLNERLLVIGTGPERKRLEKMSNDNIEFLGFKSDKVVRSYYSRARAFIFPQEEDFGLTPIEAMASGVPVIALKKGGALETIKENITGIYFENEDWQDLKSAVEKFTQIEKNFKTEELQEQANRFSCQEFKKNFSHKIREIYEKDKS